MSQELQLFDNGRNVIFLTHGDYRYEEEDGAETSRHRIPGAGENQSGNLPDGELSKKECMFSTEYIDQDAIRPLCTEEFHTRIKELQEKLVV